MRISAVVVAVATAVTLGACNKTTAPKAEMPVDCAVGEAHASPASATLHPGDTLRVRAVVINCPQDPFVPTFSWRASDTSVASVDSASGLVRARANGAATIIGSASQNQQVQIAFALTVVPQ